MIHEQPEGGAEKQYYTVSQKIVAHRTLRNIFVQVDGLQTFQRLQSQR